MASYDSDSSSSEEYENVSLSSIESVEELVEAAGNAGKQNLGLQPYLFEPYAADNGIECPDPPGQIQAQEHPNGNRLEHTDWCICQNCIVMPTDAESICCMEIQKVETTMEDYANNFSSTKTPLACITEHPGFQTVCLDIWVLKTAYTQYAMDHHADARQLPADIHRRYRYTAYRQFVRWIWGFLGRKIRVPLPSCVVSAIRKRFQSEDNTGFKYIPLHS